MQAKLFVVVRVRVSFVKIIITWCGIFVKFRFMLIGGSLGLHVPHAVILRLMAGNIYYSNKNFSRLVTLGRMSIQHSVT